MIDRNSNASGPTILRNRNLEMAVYDAMPAPMRQLWRDHVLNLEVSPYGRRIIDAADPAAETVRVVREVSSIHQVELHAYRRRIGLRP